MARRMTAAQRDAQHATVVALRETRTPFAAIGQQLDPPVTAARAHQIYEAALAANPLSSIRVDEHRVEETQLADLAVRELMGIALAVGTSDRTRVEAWVAVKGWAERKAKMLGLDAPTRTEVVTISVLDAQIAALEAELSVRAGRSEGGLDGVSGFEAQFVGGDASGPVASAEGVAG